MAEDLKNTILLGDFGTVENKELFERGLFSRIKPKIGSWRSRCYETTLQSPYKTASFRSVVFNRAKDPNSYVLLEGITPDPTGKLNYIEITKSVQPYGFYAQYTDQDTIYGFDKIASDLGDNIVFQADDFLDKIASNAWLSGNQVWTAPNGLDRETIIKIRISLKKFTRVKNARIIAVLTPEDVSELRLTYNKGGTNLFIDTSLNEESVKNGVIGRFEGVDIEEDDSPCLYGEDGKRYAIFYTVDSKGRSPVAFIKADGSTGEFIAKGLGSSGTNDPLDQRGTIGVKFKGLGAMVTADEVLARVEITPRTSGGVGNIESDYDEYGNIIVNGTKVERTGVRKVVGSPKAITILASTLSVQASSTINLKAFDELGNDITTKVTWSSGTTANATVGTNTGVVSGVKAGTSVITAKYTGYPDANVTVTVTA